MLRFRVAVLATVVTVCSSFTALGDIPKQSTGVPRFDEAVRRAVAYIQEDLQKNGDLKLGEKAIAGYTLLKAGVPNTDKGIRATVAQIKAERFNNGVFNPGVGQSPPLEHIYFSGVMALLLAADDPEGNLPALRSIAQYMISEQGADGSWDYPQRTTGDTSMNQYGVLGLWACMRAGVKVPPSVWDRCLAWHVSKRSSDGGWAYHPGSPAGPGRGASTPNMSYGAAGTMAICRLLIYPDYAPGGAKRKKAKKKLFGILEETETSTGSAPGRKSNNPYEDYKPSTAIGRIDGAIDSALNWCGTRFRTTNSVRGYPMYYYYAMERALAMNEVTNLSGHDWYRECGEELLASQNADGAWEPGAHGSSPTCFGVLFFIKATRNLLVATYGNGIQVGKRGFDLDGDPLADEKKKKKLGPLDEMLARMEQMQLNNVKDVPEEDLTDLVNKILQTPRKELVNHLAVLKKLKDYPRGDVRSVAMFGLGRSGDMRVAPLLIDGLNDNDVGVLSEAHTALCYISRKPQGFGLKDDLAGEVEGLEQAEVDKIVNKWRKQAQGRWRAWYKRIRPYDERGDLWEITGSSTSGSSTSGGSNNGSSPQQ